MNRAARRKAESGIDPREREAWRRLEQRRQVAATVRVSDAAAMRAYREASPAARRLIAGMIHHVMAEGGTDRCVFEDAVRAMGGRTLSWRTVDELHERGILRWQDGAHVLHRVFSSTGQEWARVATGGGRASVDGDMAGLGNVVEFAAQSGVLS